MLDKHYAYTTERSWPTEKRVKQCFGGRVVSTWPPMSEAVSPELQNVIVSGAQGSNGVASTVLQSKEIKQALSSMEFCAIRSAHLCQLEQDVGRGLVRHRWATIVAAAPALLLAFSCSRSRVAAVGGAALTSIEKLRSPAGSLWRRCRDWRGPPSADKGAHVGHGRGGFVSSGGLGPPPQQAVHEPRHEGRPLADLAGGKRGGGQRFRLENASTITCAGERRRYKEAAPPFCVCTAEWQLLPR